MRPQKRTTDATFTVSEWGTWTSEWELEIEKQKHQKWKNKQTIPTTNQTNKQKHHFPLSRPQTTFS